MLVLEMLLAMIPAVIFSVGLTLVLGRRGPGPLGGGLLFFGLLFLLTWAVGIWVRPFGPLLGDTVPWLIYFVVALVAALMIAALTPSGPATTRDDSIATLGRGLGLLVWLVLVILTSLVALGYLIR